MALLATPRVRLVQFSSGYRICFGKMPTSFSPLCFSRRLEPRFDERGDPFLYAPTLCFDPMMQMPHIDLRLYNHTGNGVGGFHSDPVCLRRPQSRATVQNSKTLKTCQDLDGGEHVKTRKSNVRLTCPVRKVCDT